MKKVNTAVEFVSIREASKITGINPQTLRILADQNKIKSYKTASGQRKFDKNFLEEMCNSQVDTENTFVKKNTNRRPSEDNSEELYNYNDKNEICESNEYIKEILELDQDLKGTKINIIYARLSPSSSNNNLQSLNKQVEYIKASDIKYNDYKVITDLSSRESNVGAKKIIDFCLDKNIGEVVIAHKDRVPYTYTDFFKHIIEVSGGFITNLNNVKYKTSNKEIFMNILSATYNYFLHTI